MTPPPALPRHSTKAPPSPSQHNYMYTLVDTTPDPDAHELCYLYTDCGFATVLRCSLRNPASVCS